jgi:hypothetical protein
LPTLSQLYKAPNSDKTNIAICKSPYKTRVRCRSVLMNEVETIQLQQQQEEEEEEEEDEDAEAET